MMARSSAGLFGSIIGAAALALMTTVAEARSAKPKPPAGRDPGGIAVAMIGAGLDYRRPEVAQRLARDGEGEAIAWDFADDDARPFHAGDADGALVRIVLMEGPSLRLVPIRVADGRQEQIAAALRFAGATPARIVVVITDSGTPLPLAGLTEVARHFPRQLLVVPARLADAHQPSHSAEADRGGLLLVGAAGAASVDLVVSAGSRNAAGHADEAAAVRVATFAARLLGVEPSLTGAALRARLLSMSTSPPGAPRMLPDAEGLPLQK